MQGITEEAYMDQAAQNAEIIKEMPCGFAIIEFTDHFEVRFLNDWTRLVSGYTQEEIDAGQGRCLSLFDDVCPEDMPEIDRTLQTVLAGTDVFTLIYRVRHKDGHFFYVKLSGTVKYRTAEKITVYGVYTDVDKEVRLRQQLAQEKAEKENLIDSIPGGIAKYTVTPDGKLKILYCSNGMAELVGKTLEQYLRDFEYDWTANIYAGDLEMVKAALENCLRAHETVDVTYRLIHTDGHLVWVNVQARIIGRENGMPMAHVVFHGVSSEDRLYQELLNNTDTIVQVSDLKTREILYVNRAAANFAGRRMEEFAGKTCYAYMMHAQQLCPFCKLDGMEGGIRRQVELGGACYDVRGEKIDWNGHEAFVEYVDDITDSWKMQKRLRAEKESLEAILDRIPAGVVVFRLERNGKMHVEASNQTIREMMHVTKEQLDHVTEERFFGSVYQNELGKVKELFKGMLESVHRRTCELCVKRPDTSDAVWLRFDGDGIEQEDGSLLVYAVYTDISAQKEIEQEKLKSARKLKEALAALSQSHRSLQMAAQQAKLTYWQVDLKTGEMASEQRKDWQDFIEKRGITSAEFAKLIISPEDHAIYQTMRERVASGMEDHVEFDLHVILPESGKSVWRRVIYDLVRDESGAPARLLGLAQDIDEFIQARRRFDEELDEIENAVERKEVLVTVRANLTQNRIENYQAKSVCNLQLNVGDRYTDGTAALVKVALTEEQRAEILHWHSRDQLLARFENGENSYSFDFQRKLSDGRVIWVNSAARLYRQPGGTDVMCFMYCYDVDELHLARDVAAKVVESNFEFLAVIDTHTGKIEYSIAGRDGRFYPKVGDDYERDIADAFRFIASSDTRNRYTTDCGLTNITNILKTANEFSYPVDTTAATGSRRKLIQYLWLDEQRSKLLMTHSDITAVYQQEIQRAEQLCAALDEAKQANRAKSDFLSRMSHDIRTPMNAIIGLTALTLDEANNPQVVTENLSKIRSSSDFLLGLVNDILDMAKIEEGVVTLRREPYRYTEFISNIKTIFSPLCAQKGIHFDFENVTENLTILTDKVRLNQVFFNILSNAVKYTPEGGSISYHTENRCVEGSRVSADYIISDTGIGMSEEFQRHMYEPFSQEDSSIKPQLQGSGLGLSIVKNLVELMGGTIEVSSKVGAGTSVRVHLSFELAPQQQLSPLENGNYESDVDLLKGKRVLLCEDHPLNAEIAKKLMSKKHMEVVWTENGRDAVERFADSPLFAFDLILMDIRMPVMDGLEATRTIRALSRMDAKTVPIIAMTANAYDSDIEKSRAAGMNAHLSKPIDPALLYQTLSRLCQKND